MEIVKSTWFLHAGVSTQHTKGITITNVTARTVLVTRNFMKSDEFRGNSAQIPCGFRKASVQLTTEL